MVDQDSKLHPLLFDVAGPHASNGGRRVEHKASVILSLVQSERITHLERTRDAIQIQIDDERGIVVLVTPEAFEFRVPTVEWTCGAYGPAESSRLWRRIESDEIEEGDLDELLREALAARAAEFVKCRHCGERFPPEHRTGGACHGCASLHDGVVY